MAWSEFLQGSEFANSVRELVREQLRTVREQVVCLCLVRAQTPCASRFWQFSHQKYLSAKTGASADFWGWSRNIFEKLRAWADERIPACEDRTSTVLWMWLIRKSISNFWRWEKNLKLKDVVDANVHYKVYGSQEHIYVPCMQAWSAHVVLCASRLHTLL